MRTSPLLTHAAHRALACIDPPTTGLVCCWRVTLCPSPAWLWPRLCLHAGRYWHQGTLPAPSPLLGMTERQPVQQWNSGTVEQWNSGTVEQCTSRPQLVQQSVQTQRATQCTGQQQSVQQLLHGPAQPRKRVNATVSAKARVTVDSRVSQSNSPCDSPCNSQCGSLYSISCDDSPSDSQCDKQSVQLSVRRSVRQSVQQPVR